MPMTVEEYQVAQLYTVAQASRENTKGDTAVKILVNEPFDNERGAGQFTHKVYHLGSKIPGLVAALMPNSALTLVEKAWNSFPHCRTEYTNPFLKERFSITLESLHYSDAGNSENAFNLTPKELMDRRVVYLDISADKVPNQPQDREPSQFLSKKTGRGQLGDKWWEQHQPIMCCYKLVTVKFHVFGLQTRIEDIIFKNQVEILTRFHKDVFCAIDGWYGLTMADIRMIEEQVKNELDEKIRELDLPAEKETDTSGSVKSTPF